ncbi:hypothetical protein RCL1_001866 [Eukaryota sp. TZLM3-RCL]
MSLMKFYPFFFSFLLAFVASVQITAAPADDLQHIFASRPNGFLGADVATSIPHPSLKNTSFWLFGDTLIGTSTPTSRNITGMPRNSIALLNHETLQPAFYHSNMGSSSFFNPPRFSTHSSPSSAWVWPISAISYLNSIIVTSYHVVDDAEDPFGFAVDKNCFHFIQKPSISPSTWSISTVFIPFSCPQLLLGPAVLTHGDVAYFVALEEKTIKRNVLIRSKASSLLQFNFYEILIAEQGGNKWVPLNFYLNNSNFEPFSFGTDTNECSLIFWNNKFIYFYGENFGSKIFAKISDSLIGPWSEPLFVYEVPSDFLGNNRFFYAVKAHPELSRDNFELILTYATNSFDPKDLEKDPELYVPRFVRTRWNF